MHQEQPWLDACKDYGGQPKIRRTEDARMPTNHDSMNSPLRDEELSVPRSNPETSNASSATSRPVRHPQQRASYESHMSDASPLSDYSTHARSSCCRGARHQDARQLVGGEPPSDRDRMRQFPALL